MLVLLDENPNVQTIFGARFGGISRCDDFAKGVIMFLKEHGLSKPMVMRMTGNMWQEGVRIFDEERKANPELFKHIAFREYLMLHPGRAKWLAERKIEADRPASSRAEYIENKSSAYQAITKESLSWADNERNCK